MAEERKPWGFCETPNEKCTMNCCDENGCMNRKRVLVESPIEKEGSNDLLTVRLIPMTEFVLTENISHNQIVKYAHFLKQLITLGMFVPVDKRGVILEEPKTCCSGYECGCMGMPYNYSSNEELDDYLEAEKNVLFEGFYSESNSIFEYNGARVDLEGWIQREVETLIGLDLKLSRTAQEQIGLCESQNSAIIEVIKEISL